MLKFHSWYASRPRSSRLAWNLSFWLNFGYVIPAIKYAPKLVELLGFNNFCMIMSYVSWNQAERWRWKHRNRPPTHPHTQTLLIPSKRVKINPKVKANPSFMNSKNAYDLFLSFAYTLDSGWLTPSPLNIDPYNNLMENMIHFFFSVLRGFCKIFKIGGMLSSLSTHS